LLGTLPPENIIGKPARSTSEEDPSAAAAHEIGGNPPDCSGNYENHDTSNVPQDVPAEIVEDARKEPVPDNGHSIDAAPDLPIVELASDERVLPEGEADDQAEKPIPFAEESSTDADGVASTPNPVVDQLPLPSEAAVDSVPEVEAPPAVAPAAEVDPSSDQAPLSVPADFNRQPTLTPAAPKPTVFRDRRGARRAADSQKKDVRKPEQDPSAAIRQAEARFRLTIDPIRRSIILSLVLSRPEGFPEFINVDSATGPTQAFDQDDHGRYDDIEVI